MTQPEIPLLPLDRRPELAGKLIRLWRIVHLARGEEMAVIVMPGEWPDPLPATVEDVPVQFNEVAGGTGGMMILARIGKLWRVAYTVAYRGTLDMPLSKLRQMVICAEIDRSKDDMTLWMAPSPTTGQVPMWKMSRPSLRQ